MRLSKKVTAASVLFLLYASFIFASAAVCRIQFLPVKK